MSAFTNMVPNIYPTAPTAVPNNQQVVIPQITIPQPLQYYTAPQQTAGPSGLSNIPGPQLLKTNQGVDGVKQFQTVANAQYAIFAEDDDVFWVKETDKNNYPVSLRRFRFYEEEEPTPESTETVSKADYDELLSEVRSMREEIKSLKEEKANGQQPVRSQNQSNGKPNNGANNNR